MGHMRVSNKKRVHPGLYSGTVSKELFKRAKKQSFSFKIRHALAGQEAAANGFWSFFGNKKAVLGLVLIVSIIGGIVISQSSAFHSYQSKPCVRLTVAGAPCEDPQTGIWQRNVGAPASLADFSLSAGQRQIYQTSCDSVGGDACIELNAFSGNNSVAVTQNTVGDLGIANGKTLAFSFGYVMTQSGFGTNIPWGFFLTTNKTAAVHNIGSTSQYNPLNDPSVVFDLHMVCTAGTCGGTGTAGTYSTVVYVNKSPGSGRSLSQEDTGSCGGTAGSCVMFLSNTSPSGCLTNPCTGSNVVNTMGFYANYTGATSAGAVCAVTGGVFGGSGCSWIFNFVSAHNPVVSADAGGVTNIIANSWLHGDYYLGFYSMLPGVPIEFEFYPGFIAPSGYTIGSNTFYYVPSPISTSLGPQIDTGGYFGSIIKSLIGVGVLVVTAIASFFSLIFTAFKTALDTVGNFLGIGAIGTQLANAFSEFATWVGSIFSSGFTNISNAITFLVNSLTAISNTIGTYWALLNSFLSDLTSFLGGLWTVLSAFLQYSSIGLKYGLVLWWILGIGMAYRDVRLWLNTWTKISFLMIKTPFDIGMWFYDHIIEKVLLRAKMLIFDWI